MKNSWKKILIVFVGGASLYAFAKMIAKNKREDKSIDDDNLYLEPYVKDPVFHDPSSQSIVFNRENVGIYESKIKPMLDQILSFGGLVILSPLIAVISLAIVIDDPGPVFFAQKRVGKDKHYMYIHKFRSMRSYTPCDVPTHQMVDPELYITRVGRILRKTSLDELPQMWDILRGCMSIIGPRPALWNQNDLVEERDKYGANGVMPGLTGLAQIKGRDELTIPDKAKLDGEYAAKLKKGGVFAFFQDISCFFGTVISVLKHDGIVEGGTGTITFRKIEIPMAEENGFEDYGFRKMFSIDKEVHKRVLITGVGSYIGESFKSYCEKHYLNIQCESVDMLDGSWRDKDFSNYDTVFHVAGIAHVDVGRTSFAEQEKYYAINTDLAIETAEKAKADGVRQFIFISSMIIYGESAPMGQKKIIDEETLPAPSNFYGNSKWLADKGVRKLGSDTFHVAVLRLPMVYGKGAKGNYQILAKMARILPIFPEIENERSMIYVENLCEFVGLLTLSGENGIYFPQNREYSKTSSLVEMIGEKNGKKVKVSKSLSLAIAAASYIPGKVSELVNKAFGNSCYDQVLSIYKGLNYQKVSLKESIEKTEIDQIKEFNELLPLVSVIIAAYNCEYTIGETIESVIAQTYSNWEMIIVNDASTDRTVSVIESYLKRDYRIRLINLTYNSGSAKARNTAIENAKGRFLAILDSDDLWKRNKLQKQVNFMMQNNYAFTFTSYEVFHESKDKVRKVFVAPDRISYKQYLRNTIIGNLTVMIDKEQVENFHIINGELEDVLTWMYFLRKGYIAYGMHDNLASYRVTSSSKSGNKLKNAKKYYKCLETQPISAFERFVNELCYLINASKKRFFGKVVEYK